MTSRYVREKQYSRSFLRRNVRENSSVWQRLFRHIFLSRPQGWGGWRRKIDKIPHFHFLRGFVWGKLTSPCRATKVEKLSINISSPLSRGRRSSLCSILSDIIHLPRYLWVAERLTQMNIHSIVLNPKLEIVISCHFQSRICTSCKIHIARFHAYWCNLWAFRKI